MRAEYLGLLVCPECHGELIWTVIAAEGARIESADMQCAACGAAYAVREGVGLFLPPDLPREDWWERTDSHLTVHLREHPDVAHQLLDGPLDALAPADRFYRAMILEERGQYAAAEAAVEAARPALYTAEYLACMEAQLLALLAALPADSGPIVDLASGRGTLVERLARRGTQPVIATDFSPRVLYRTQRRLRYLGLGERVTYLACDARRTPFRAGAIATLTSYLGLVNMSDGATVVRELRRIVAGRFLVIGQSYAEDDAPNAAAIEAMGAGPVLFARRLLALFAAAGWQVDVLSRCVSPARPTPTSRILDGAGIDGLPVAPTTIEWSLLSASVPADRPG